MATMGGETLKAHLGMALLQLFNGGYYVITKVALNDGVDQLVFCFYRDLIALLILSPIAFFKERQTRPPITKQLFMSFFFLGLIGIFGSQVLFLYGLGYTNPTYASALQPSIPVFTFLLAVIMGVERLNLQSFEGLTKVGGTVICVSGAIFMALYHGPSLIGYTEPVIIPQNEIIVSGQPEAFGWLITDLQNLGVENFELGVMFLIGNCTGMAAFLAIQAQVLKKYPAYLSATAFSFFFGVVLMAIVSLFMTNLSSDWILTQSEIPGGCLCFMTWSNKILGPTLVALYIPLQPAFAAILSQIFLGSPIYLGSIIGGSLIIAGLFGVTWASYKDREATVEISSHDSWVSEPHIHEKSAHQRDHIFPGSSSASTAARSCG